MDKTVKQSSPKRKNEEKSGVISSEKALNALISSVGSGEDYGASIYENYEKLYRDEADRAAQNVYGLAANSTGGYGNSYAASAAAQVYGDYANRLAEKKSELEDKEYERKRDRADDIYRVYGLIKDKEDDEYRREKENGQTAYERERDDYDRALSFAVTAAANGDYSHLQALGADTSNAVKKQALDFAVTAADKGDYSYLEALGIDTSGARAEMLARYGDYSGLTALGADVSGLKRDEMTSLAEIYAKYGDYSLLRLLGVNTKNKEEDDAAQRRLAYARYLSLLE